jgi:hypothetical protein
MMRLPSTKRSGAAMVARKVYVVNILDTKNIFA